MVWVRLIIVFVCQHLGMFIKEIRKSSCATFRRTNEKYVGKTVIVSTVSLTTSVDCNETYDVYSIINTNTLYRATCDSMAIGYFINTSRDSYILVSSIFKADIIF